MQYKRTEIIIVNGLLQKTPFNEKILFKMIVCDLFKFSIHRVQI